MLPILINKKITHNIFKKTITHFENSNNLIGLWSSLNFVKIREIKKIFIKIKTLP